MVIYHLLVWRKKDSLSLLYSIYLNVYRYASYTFLCLAYYQIPIRSLCFDLIKWNEGLACRTCWSKHINLHVTFSSFKFIFPDCCAHIWYRCLDKSMSIVCLYQLLQNVWNYFYRTNIQTTEWWVFGSPLIIHTSFLYAF